MARSDGARMSRGPLEDLGLAQGPGACKIGFLGVRGEEGSWMGLFLLIANGPDIEQINAR